MKKPVFEDLTQEKLSWLIEFIEGMFLDPDENDTC